MRTLHLVESNIDAGRVVLETSDGQEKFELPIDPALRRALTDGPAVPTATPRPAVPSEPRITPREIQMKVRGGDSPESIAEVYGADPDWVQRFAGPVVAERERIANEARRAKARRTTTEGQSVVFGEAVDERFAQHGIDPQTVRWDAHRRDDGQWVLSARWVGGQSDRRAEWSFHLSGRTVAPMDDTAADLLSDRPIRPLPAPEPPSDLETTAPNLTLAPPVGAAIDAAIDDALEAGIHGGTDAGLTAVAVTPDAHTGRLPRAEELFDQAAFDEPHLPLHVPDAPQPRERTVTDLGVARRDAEPDEDKAARAAIPSWDDILLGVRRKHD